uniref:Histone domain-containing protein n=1 Tax=Panagrellus redivivus TaxID=6233 RepID=A0A7E4V1V9_PANRE
MSRLRQCAFKTTGSRPSEPRAPIPALNTSKSSRRKSLKPKKSLRNIRDFEHSYLHQIPKAAFQRVIRSLLREVSGADYRITATALEALQEVAEEYVTNHFEQLNILANHAKRVTVMASDAVSLQLLDSFKR